jgi:hypothetical protein
VKHNFGAQQRRARTFRVNAELVWTHGVPPTDYEVLTIGATISTSGPHCCTFKCPCCEKVIGVLGRDMGIGPEWILAVTTWERLRSGDTLRPK